MITPIRIDITAKATINHPMNTFTGIPKLAILDKTLPYKVKITLNTPYKLAKVALTSIIDIDEGALPYESGSHICIGTIPAFIARATINKTRAILSKKVYCITLESSAIFNALY